MNTKERKEALDRIGEHVAAFTVMSDHLRPFGSKYQRLKLNLALSGATPDEKVVLNLRKDEWPDMFNYCTEYFGNRILGMTIRWV